MYYCHYCTRTFHDWDQYIFHQKFHNALTIHKVLYCGYYGICNKYFKDQKILRKHVMRAHAVRFKSNLRNQQSQLLDENAKMICSVDTCRKQFHSPKKFLVHIKNHIIAGYVLICPFRNCKSTYGNGNSFRSHVTRKHTSLQSCKLPTSLNEVSRDSLDSSEIEDYRKIYFSNLANFYLKLETKYRLPASTVNLIANDLETLRYQEDQISKSQFQEYLKHLNITEDIRQIIIQKFFGDNIFLEMNRHLKSNHRREKWFFAQELFVAPKRISLGCASGNEKFFYYIPIEETIKSIYKSQCYKDFLDLPRRRTDENILVDYTSGKSYKNNTFFKDNVDLIEIILSADGFQTLINPLGSARKKYKMLAIYMTIANLSPLLRSQVNSIQLVALVNEKWFNHDMVFGLISDEIRKLEIEGIQLLPNHRRKVGLVHLLGDNYGSHGVGGYVESFGPFVEYICRYCESSRCGCLNPYICENERKYRPQLARLRTVATYDETLIELEKHRKLKKGLNNFKGIKFNSTLNRLKSYHVCNPGLPPCIAHDLMEGVVSYDLMLIIKAFVEDGYFTFEDFNKELESFPFQFEDGRNKPKPLDPKAVKISGSASEMRTLLRFSVYFIAKLMEDKQSEYWICLIDLIELVEIAYSPTIHTSFLGYLEKTIDGYLDLRIKLFSIDLRPKHHYLSHYPYLIYQFGPLSKVCTLRCESKHKFFKNAIRSTLNFRNVTKTCAFKHQLYQYLVNSGFEMPKIIDYKNTKDFILSNYSDEIQNKITAKCKSVSGFLESNTIFYHSINYNAGQIIIYQSLTYQRLLAGKIMLILIESNTDTVYLVLKEKFTTFIPNLRLYEIDTTRERYEKYVCIKIDQVLHEPLNIYEFGNKMTFKLKHEIVGQEFVV